MADLDETRRMMETYEAAMRYIRDQLDARMVTVRLGDLRRLVDRAGWTRHVAQLEARIETLEEALRKAPRPDHVMDMPKDRAYADWFHGQRRALLNHKD